MASAASDPQDPDRESDGLRDGESFNPATFYSFNRMPQRRSSPLNSTSRDYEVYFTNIETVLDKLKEVFDHLIRTLVNEIEHDMPNHSHRIRLVLNAPTLNYPIHIPFYSPEDFDVDLVLNEIQRVVNSNESFDISNNIKVNILSVSLPSMGGKKIGGIDNRMVPDIKCFKKQKKAVISIHSASETPDCLLRGLAVGMALLKRNNSKQKSHLYRESAQKTEKNHLLHSLRTDKTFDIHKIKPNLQALFDPFADTHLEVNNYSISKLGLEELQYICECETLAEFCVSLYDCNFMGAFLKSFNQQSDKHIDLLYDSQTNHVDVITSMKALFMARFYCYACHKPFSTTKHLCSASGCLLCRQPTCRNTQGFVCLDKNVEDHRVLLLECSQCGYKLRSQKCLDCHISSGVCHQYVKCHECNSTISKQSSASHMCSRKRCNVCSVYYFTQLQIKTTSERNVVHQCFVQHPSGQKRKHPLGEPEVEEGAASIKRTRVEIADEEKQQQPVSSSGKSIGDDSIWVFDIETDQSCEFDGFHKPILLIAKTLTGHEDIFLGYDCINKFCQSVFSDLQRVRKEEWFVAHFGSGFDFLPILEWLYAQHKFVPKILLRGNKVVSLKVGNKRFIDSYLFIPVPLSSFPKTFGIKDAAKGYFPHFLSSSEAISLSSPSSGEEDPKPGGKQLHSYRRCPKNKDCSLRQLVSHDCNHCLAFITGRDALDTEEFMMEAGQFPPPCLFGIKNMKKADEVATFLRWHQQKCTEYQTRQTKYDFCGELTLYCRSDVELLRKGFTEYRRLIKSICSDIDPFQVACTAASACNYIYRQLFMPRDSIAILPLHGYSGNEKTSFPATLWLKWLESIANTKIAAAKTKQKLRMYRAGGGSKYSTGREQKLSCYKADGLLIYCDPDKTKLDVHKAVVCEFFGCFFHGCLTCYPDRAEINRKIGMTMDQIYTSTVTERLNWYEQQKKSKKCWKTSDGYHYVVYDVFYVWECEFKDVLAGENVPSHASNKVVADDDTSDGWILSATDLDKNESRSKLLAIALEQNIYSPLRARDAFVGGRTENFVSWWTKQCSEEIFCYTDICSLYPFVNARCVYPHGHPDIVVTANEESLSSDDGGGAADGGSGSGVQVGEEGAGEITLFENQRKLDLSGFIAFAAPSSREKFKQANLSQIPRTYIEEAIQDDNIFGLIKCCVLPPSDLLIPVLPYKCNAKLFFPLCRSCAESRTTSLNNRSLEMTSNLCEHYTVQDRSFWGTYVSVEIQLALKKGYRIVDVSEVWSWSKTKRTTNLFKDYINTFLKIKTEASGWPEDCSCNNHDSNDKICPHRERYLREYFEKEHIRLEPQKIQKNEGLRFIAKILLNSFWGYLGMRDNMPKTKYINSYRDVIEHFTSKTKRVTDAALVGDDLMLLQYQLIDDAADSPRKTNVILAAFTTAHARVILYNYLSKIKNQENILYCDTDSVMYVHDTRTSHDFDISTGSFLGDMTDELPRGVEIDKFWSAGPKFYCFTGQDTSKQTDYSVFKIKGVTLNRCVERYFNPDTFKRLVLGETHLLESPFTTMNRSVKRGTIQTKYFNKKSRVTNSKRIYNSISGKSVPFGYLFNTN